MVGTFAKSYLQYTSHHLKPSISRYCRICPITKGGQVFCLAAFSSHIWLIYKESRRLSRWAPDPVTSVTLPFCTKYWLSVCLSPSNALILSGILVAILLLLVFNFVLDLRAKSNKLASTGTHYILLDTGMHLALSLGGGAEAEDERTTSSATQSRPSTIIIICGIITGRRDFVRNRHFDVEHNASPAAVFLKAAKIEGTWCTPFCQITPQSVKQVAGVKWSEN